MKNGENNNQNKLAKKFIHLFRKSVLNFCLLGVFYNVSAQTIFISIASGDWNSGKVWKVSGSGKPVTYSILKGYNITLNDNISQIDSLKINGTLDMGNNRTITMTKTGKISVDVYGTISGGSANSEFRWEDGEEEIEGPFTAKRIVTNGPRYATLKTTEAAEGDVQKSFVFEQLALPMELVSFSAKQYAAGYSVSWTAMGSSELDTFNLFISTDGTHFILAGKLACNSEGGMKKYGLNIANSNKNAYLRLELNENGLSRILSTIYAKESLIEGGEESIKVYPTLLNSTANSINIMNKNIGTYSLNIYDMSMKNISNMSINTSMENEVYKLDLAIAGLTKNGMYFILIKDSEGNCFKTRVLVQN